MVSRPHQTPIIPRSGLEFGLDGDIPKYWLGGDAFRTRYADGLSMTFPVGERFFISAVRRFRDRIRDPALREAVRDFMRQEGQHGMVHQQWNQRLQAQGAPLAEIEGTLQRFLDWQLRVLPETWPLAYTAAIEHLTAIMAEMVFEHPDFLGGADERMRAVFAWHAVEEFEHKAVAFDVMKDVAGVGYVTRVLIMAAALTVFQVMTLYFLGTILKRDGFNRRQRLGLWLRGLWWLYKPFGGVLTRMTPSILHYFRPGYHPSRLREPREYRLWNERFQASGDPLAASRATLRAA